MKLIETFTFFCTFLLRNLFARLGMCPECIYNNFLSCEVNALRCNFPYRSGNILAVRGFWNLKQILAGFQIPGRLGRSSLLLWVAILPLDQGEHTAHLHILIIRDPWLKYSKLFQIKYERIISNSAADETENATIAALSLLHWTYHHSLMPTLRDGWVSMRRVTHKVADHHPT